MNKSNTPLRFACLKLKYLTTIVALFSLTTFTYAQTQPASQTQPLVIAHRGASYEAPENTLAAFKLAWQKGADGIEMDVYLTPDKHVVISHDASTKRTAGVDYEIESTPLSELKTLDVGSWKGDQFAGEKLPTLPEVLATVPQGKLAFIEIKGDTRVVRYIKRDIQESGINPSQIRIISFNPQAVKESREQMPNVKAYVLFSFEKEWTDKHGIPNPRKIINELKRTHANGVDINDAPPVNQDFLNQIKNAGFEYHIWTVDQPDLAQKYANWGVDSITTNRPDFIRNSLQNSNSMNPSNSTSSPSSPSSSPDSSPDNIPSEQPTY